MTSSPNGRFAPEEIFEEKTARSKRRARALCPPAVSREITKISRAQLAPWPRTSDEHKSLGGFLIPITQVDASVDCSEKLGATEREHVGLQERLIGSIGHVHNPSSAVRTLQPHRLAREQEMAAIIARANQVYRVVACSGRARRRRCRAGRRGGRARRRRRTPGRGARCRGSRPPRAPRSPAGATPGPGRNAAAGRARARRTRPARPAPGYLRRRRACRRARPRGSRSTAAAAGSAAGTTPPWRMGWAPLPSWSVGCALLAGGGSAAARRGERI